MELLQLVGLVAVRGYRFPLALLAGKVALLNLEPFHQSAAVIAHHLVLRQGVQVEVVMRDRAPLRSHNRIVHFQVEVVVVQVVPACKKVVVTTALVIVTNQVKVELEYSLISPVAQLAMVVVVQAIQIPHMASTVRQPVAGLVVLRH